MSALRPITALLCVYYGLIAAVMLAVPAYWYGATPGVVDAGPFNGHFVVDIGLTYAVSAACFGFWAARPGFGRPLAAAAAAWPALHALFHLSHWVHGVPAGAVLWTEIGGILVPAALGVFVAARAPANLGRA